MNDLKKLLPAEKHLSAVDLRKLPADERSAILGAQAVLAADLYRRDRQLTDFEAFGEEDLHGDGPHTEAGVRSGSSASTLRRAPRFARSGRSS